LGKRGGQLRVGDFDTSAPLQSHESKLIINGVAGGDSRRRNFRFLLASISVIIKSVHQFQPIKTIK
jgi:hypothetical protein